MKLSTVLATTIVGASVTFVAAPSVAALSDCASGATCIWADNDFKGDRQGRSGGSGTITNVSALLNDRMDSWANRSASYTSCGWDGKNGTADAQTWGATSNDNNVSPFSSDEVSSWRTRYGC
jgi:hypothetical protein